jgi:hydrogenase nickel incorporation protein HypB
MPVDVLIMKAVNAENTARAAEVRAQLDARRILGLNFMSSPGSGKTSLLEATFKRLGGRLRFAVVEGDVYTALDAERIARHGVAAVQINTEGSCHMTAHMLLQALPRLDLATVDVLVIENIGNLICPAGFSLGEHLEVALLSTPEGADKVDKYPRLFAESHVNVITKTDLAPHVDFDVAAVTARLAQLNPAAPVLAVSAKTGAGLDEWCDWLTAQRQAQLSGAGA